MERNEQENMASDRGLLSSLGRLGMGGKPSGSGGYGYPAQAYPPQPQPQGCPHVGYGYPPPPSGYPHVVYPPMPPPCSGGYPPVPPPYQAPAGAGKPGHNTGSMLAGGAAGAAAAYGLHRLFHGGHHQHQHGHGHHGKFKY